MRQSEKKETHFHRESLVHSDGPMTVRMGHAGNGFLRYFSILFLSILYPISLSRPPHVHPYPFPFIPLTTPSLPCILPFDGKAGP